MNLVEQIDSHHENIKESTRGHLGASQIGRECRREIWYSFRWANKPNFPGRIKRLFRHGFGYEDYFQADLRAVGYVVLTKHRKTGEDIGFKDIDGHFSGTVDGIGAKDGEYFLLEFKTHNEKSFKSLVKNKVFKAKPEHYAQMQVYMHYMKLKNAIYLSVNKNTDELYSEIVEYDEFVANKMVERARIIIESDEPLEQVNTDPNYFKCRFCDHNKTCHGGELPEVNCRTCEYASPAKDGKWSCGMHEKILSHDEQLKGCEEHKYIRKLVSDDRLPDYGKLPSLELKAVPVSMIGDQVIKDMRDAFGARIVE